MLLLIAAHQDQVRSLASKSKILPKVWAASRVTLMIFAPIILFLVTSDASTLSNKPTKPAQPDYGILGNLIVRLADDWQSNTTSTDVMQPHRHDGLSAVRPNRAASNQAPDYGILGNLIVRLADSASGQPNATSVEATAPRRSTGYVSAYRPMRLASDRKPDYGPLGNLIAWLFDGTTGDAKEPVCTSSDEIASTAGTSPARKTNVLPELASATAASATAPDAKPKAPRTPNPGLKSLRDFFRMLWSNFLPDPVFDRAVEAFKLRDKDSGIYAAAGEGGFITGREREQLLLWAGANSM